MTAAFSAEPARKSRAAVSMEAWPSRAWIWAGSAPPWRSRVANVCRQRRCHPSAVRSALPGSRHKSGGWRLLSMSLADAEAVVGQPSGPEAWAALLTELAAELREVQPASSGGRGQRGDNRLVAERDDASVPWVPRLGGRAPLSAEFERVARSGRWDRARYPAWTDHPAEIQRLASRRDNGGPDGAGSGHSVSGGSLGRECLVLFPARRRRWRLSPWT